MEPEQFVAAQLVALFAEKNWLPHGAIFTQVFGDWYRVDVKVVSEDFVYEEGLAAVERAG